VLPPQGLYTPEAEFSDEARRAKFQGSVTVQCIVDAQGHVQNPRVIHDPGMGLGEKALETVKTWRFKPGTLNGKPVAVWITAEVDFTIY
jgi:TonB family protein